MRKLSQQARNECMVELRGLPVSMVVVALVVVEILLFECEGQL